MGLICFDTNFVIWGIKGESSPGQEDCIGRAQHVINQCEKNGDTIVIPAVVLGEALCGIPLNDRESFVREMSASGFVVMPFDTKASIHFARMWDNRAERGNCSRSEMKADYMIAAVAVANDCQKIYSHDNGLIRFAEEHIPVLTINDIHIPPRQAQLFED